MGTFLYDNVYESLKKKIEDNSFQIGDILPNEQELATQYKVSAITIKRALNMLKDDGYIARKPKKGSVVISKKNDSLPTSKMDDIKENLLGLVITNFTDFFGAEILRSIIHNHSYNSNFIIKISYGDPEQEDKLIQELIEVGVHGLIILPSSSQYTSPYLLQLISNNFPVVVIDRLMENLPICSVTSDSFQAAKDLTKLLLNDGHNKIGLITANSHVTTIDERINGFISAHIDENIAISHNQILSEIDSVIPNSSKNPLDDITQIKHFIQHNSDISAILTTEYNIALLVKSAIKELSHTIPNDISLTCFDHPHLNIFEKSAFVITHVEQNQIAIGNEAVKLLREKINNPNLIKKIKIPCSIVPGNSVKSLL